MLYAFIMMTMAGLYEQPQQCVCLGVRIPDRIRRTALRAVLLFSVLPINACQHFSQIPPEPVDAAENAGKLIDRSLDDPAVSDSLSRYGLMPPAGGDWSLDQLTVAAWTLRPDTAVALARLAAAESETEVAALPPNLTLNGNGEGVVNDTDASSPWVLGAGLGLLLETGGKREIRRDRARIMEQVLETRLGGTLWSIRSEVRRAAFARQFAADLLALDREETGLRRDYLNWVDTRLQYGAANSQDRLQASLALSEAQSRAGIDQAALTRAAVELAGFIGISPQGLEDIRPLIPPPADLPQPLVENPQSVRDMALLNRLDIRQSLQEYQLAEQDLRAAVAQQYPDLNLGPGILYDQGDHKLTLGLSLPVGLTKSSKAKINAAIAGRTLAARTFDQVQAGALADIESGYALYRAAQESVNTALESEQAAAAALRTSKQLLEAGAADRGDELAAEIVLLQRRQNTLAARRSLVEAVSRLEDAVQRPLFPPSSLETSPEILTGVNTGGVEP